MFEYPVESDLTIEMTISFTYNAPNAVMTTVDKTMEVKTGETSAKYYPTYYGYEATSINSIDNIQVKPQSDSIYNYCPKSGPLIVFYIRTYVGEIYEYTCEDWMTWLDFVYSDYNNGDVKLSDSEYVLHMGIQMSATYPEDQIAEGKIYYVSMGSGGS